jgi:hypothetical protein
VEPPNVKMTGYNKSATVPLKVVILYVGDPERRFWICIEHATCGQHPH